MRMSRVFVPQYKSYPLTTYKYVTFVYFFPVLIAQAGKLPNGFSPYVIAPAVFWGIYLRLVREDKPVFVPSGSIEKERNPYIHFPVSMLFPLNFISRFIINTFSMFIFSQFIVSHLLLHMPYKVYVQMFGKPEIANSMLFN